VKPGDVDIVLATHIHVDHVGWHTTKKGDGYEPTFANAAHLFNRAEYEYWTDPAVANAAGNEHVLDCVLPLRDRADVQLVDGEYQVTDEIVLLPTPGHTPAHVSVGIMSAGESGAIIGDVCHHPAQVTELWSPVFDMNPALATKTREKLIEKLEQERRTVLAGHFAHPGFGRIVQTEGKRYWRSL
jgi:glyoxylase-like metal-dependent hydrolase (beta-lactamase superfamily II)